MAQRAASPSPQAMAGYRCIRADDAFARPVIPVGLVSIALVDQVGVDQFIEQETDRGGAAVGVR
ncbi:hypothetical protein Axi01nite_86050 [Actinoplanes xinjiangensis]|nr:hypothetical protein Axi01nite_86050 [Actinoplanes xinjiangensis]